MLLSAVSINSDFLFFVINPYIQNTVSHQSFKEET